MLEELLRSLRALAHVGFRRRGAKGQARRFAVLRRECDAARAGVDAVQEPGIDSGARLDDVLRLF
jgi:hypothetical protein